MVSSIAAPSWLGSVLAVLLVVQIAVVVLIWFASAVVVLKAKDDKRAERALEIFRIIWSSRRKR